MGDACQEACEEMFQELAGRMEDDQKSLQESASGDNQEELPPNAEKSGVLPTHYLQRSRTRSVRAASDEERASGILARRRRKRDEEKRIARLKEINEDPVSRIFRNSARRRSRNERLSPAGAQVITSPTLERPVPVESPELPVQVNIMPILIVQRGWGEWCVVTQKVQKGGSEVLQFPRVSAGEPSRFRNRLIEVWNKIGPERFRFIERDVMELMGIRRKSRWMWRIGEVLHQEPDQTECNAGVVMFFDSRSKLKLGPNIELVPVTQLVREGAGSVSMDPAERKLFVQFLKNIYREDDRTGKKMLARMGLA